MAVRNKMQVKKEFEEFAKRVAKLEALRGELNALDSKGFESDAGVIRARLKDVNAISEISREIKRLRRKIEERQRRKFHGAGETRHLKKDTEQLKRKISEIEYLVKKKRAVSSRKQLSKEEVNFVNDVPVLESRLASLRREFSEHLSHPKVRADTGVGLLVDTKFDEFISTIKVELSEKLREREKLMGGGLKADLEARKRLFAKKYQDLVDEYHEKYKQKLDTEMKNEIKKHFNKELNKRLIEERAKLVRKLLKRNTLRLAEERQRLAKRLHELYKRAAEKELDSEEQEMKSQLKLKERSLEKAKSEMHTELKEQKVQMKEEEKGVLGRLKQKAHEEFARKLENMRRVEDNGMKAILKEKEKQIMNELERQYKEKLRVEAKNQKAQIERKKLEIERHIIAHAKSLLQ